MSSVFILKHVFIRNLFIRNKSDSSLPFAPLPPSASASASAIAAVYDEHKGKGNVETGAKCCQHTNPPHSPLWWVWRACLCVCACVYCGVVRVRREESDFANSCVVDMCVCVTFLTTFSLALFVCVRIWRFKSVRLGCSAAFVRYQSAAVCFGVLIDLCVFLFAIQFLL